MFTLFACSTEEHQKKKLKSNYALSISLDDRESEMKRFASRFTISNNPSDDTIFFSSHRTQQYIDSLTAAEFSNRPELIIFVGPFEESQTDSLSIALSKNRMLWNETEGDSVIYAKIVKGDGHKRDHFVLDKKSLSYNHIKLYLGSEHLGRLTLSHMYNQIHIAQYDKQGLNIFYTFRQHGR